MSKKKKDVRAGARRVFISWSGETSRVVAQGLKDAIESAFARDEVTVFFSRVDIAAGTEWYQAIKDEVENSAVGIICLTPENVSAPWIYYEAGAMTMRYDRPAAVIPLLVNVELPARSPLRELHFKTLNREGFISMIETIAQRCGVTRYEKGKNLRCIALGAYEILRDEAGEVLSETSSQLPFGVEDIFPKGRNYIKRGSVFVAAPMYSFDREDSNQYAELHRTAEGVVEKLEEKGFDVFFGGSGVEFGEEEGSELRIPAENFGFFKHAEYLVVLYPKPLASSALIELGYALALNKKIVFVAVKGEKIPLLLMGLSVPLPNLHTYEVELISDAVGFFERNGLSFFAGGVFDPSFTLKA